MYMQFTYLQNATTGINVAHGQFQLQNSRIKGYHISGQKNTPHSCRVMWPRGFLVLHMSRPRPSMHVIHNPSIRQERFHIFQCIWRQFYLWITANLVAFMESETASKEKFPEIEPTSHEKLSDQTIIDEWNSMSVEEKDAFQKKLTWKLDLRLVPWITLLYLLSFVDRTNIGNAKIEGVHILSYSRTYIFSAWKGPTFVEHAIHPLCVNLLY